MTTVVIGGGRAFNRRIFIWESLDRLHEARQFTLVATGGAPGADDNADRWAIKRGLDRVIFPANWIGRKRAAGPFRTGMMLAMTNPGLVITFPGGIGTAILKDMARKRGVEVMEVEP